MKLNKKWHQAHKMLKNITIEERIEWHTEHLKNCQCRTDVPEKIKVAMDKRKIKP